ncbi:hypothetical protein D1007_35360 [Hordeum vulgare]|nr:hypothetical protein D1007_35360 [Hordeum vulgare]
MAERFPDDGAATNGFGRRWLHEWEAHLLHEAIYLTPPDMRESGVCLLSADGVPFPPPPSDAERHTEIMRIRESLPEDAREQPSYAADDQPL